MDDFLRENYGLASCRLEPLSGGRMNRLWRCGPWVVKLYDHGQVPRAHAERALRTQWLAAEHGLPVPAPLATRGGELWAEHSEGLVAVMPFVTGTRRERGRLNRAEAAALGEFIGRLHAVLREIRWDRMEAPHPPDPARTVADWAELKRLALAQPTQAEFDALVVEFADHVAATLARPVEPPWESVPWQLCHRDLHLDNVLFNESGRVAGLLDFDNLGPWWPGVELMMAWNLVFNADPGAPSLTPEAAEFFRAYRRKGTLPDAVWRGLPDAYRHVLLSLTWPVGQRFRAPESFRPEWVEMLSFRLGAARWLERTGKEMGDWLADN